jgi:hypothetical protein
VTVAPLTRRWGESRLVFVFDGTTEYELNCQHTAGRADEIERGCEQILRTIQGGSDKCGRHDHTELKAE